MGRRIVCLTLFCLAAVWVHCQKFYAQTDARKIVEGSYLQIKFILENADGSSFRPPAFKDFDVVSGPSNSSSTSIVNGVMDKSMSIIYGLQPKTKGKFTIGPASIVVNGKQIKTQPVQIEVVQGSEKAVAAGGDFFIKTQITDTVTYVGQQLLLDYVLYVTKDVRQVNFKTEPTFDGFYAEDIQLGRQTFSREIIDGVEYYARSIKKVALFPQQTGSYAISPVTVDLGIAKPNSSRGFFFNTELIRKRVIASGKSIIVKDPPASSLPFTGAVGRYKMSASINKRTFSTDDAIVIMMEVRGNGDNKTVVPPKWDLPDGLEMYDPNVENDEVFRGQQGTTHRKLFEYLIVAKNPGIYQLKPSFTYFNTDSSDYVTLTQNLNTIRVVKGDNLAEVAVTKERQTISGIYEKTTLKTPRNSLHHSPLHLFGLGGLTLLGLGLFILSKKKEKDYDPVQQKKDQAQSMAQKKLAKAQAFITTNASKDFYAELTTAIKTYLDDKYDIAALHINKNELLAKTQTHLTESQQDDLSTLLDRSELALYAPASSTDMSVSYDLAHGLISELG